MEVRDHKDKSIEIKKNRSLKMFSIDAVRSSSLLLICIMLVFVIFFLIQKVDSANKRAEINQQITYVKMMPSGGWQVEFEKQYQDSYDFMRSSVESAIWSYVEARHSRIPELVRNYFGKAIVFMSDAEKKRFILPTGFNAPLVAKNLSVETTEEDELLTLRFFDHTEKLISYYKSGADKVYTTNIYIKRQYRNRNTKIIDPARDQNELLTIKWRLVPEDEKRKWKRERLLANAVGLAVIEDKLYTDR